MPRYIVILTVIKDAYGASHSTIAGIAKRFVMEGMEAALGRKKQENRRRKVTGLP